MHRVVQHLKDLLRDGDLAPNGVVYVMDSTCKRCSILVRAALNRSAEGYTWLLELFPQEPNAVTRRGEAHSLAEACEGLDSKLKTCQHYLDLGAPEVERRAKEGVQCN